MKNSEIRELTTAEVIEKIESAKSDLTKMKINHAVSPLDNPNKIGEIKKDVARLKTELRSRQLKEDK
jgi:large subunit ribosomal protein L29